MSTTKGQQPWEVGTITIPILQTGKLSLGVVKMKHLRSTSEWLKQADISEGWERQAQLRQDFSKLSQTFSHTCRMSGLRGPPQSFSASSHSTQETYPDKSKELPVSQLQKESQAPAFHGGLLHVISSSPVLRSGRFQG